MGGRDRNLKRRPGFFARLLLGAGVRVYRALLRLYPREFRREWSPPMQALFARRSIRALRRSGVKGLSSWWARAGVDLARTLAVEWREAWYGDKRWPRARSGGVTRDLLQDVRFAVRRFRRTPIWTGTALATLTVGVGAVTGMFSLVYDSLIRPLPFDAPEQLVSLRAEPVDRPDRGRRFSLPLLEAWETEAPAGIEAAGYMSGTAPLQLEDGPRFVQSAWATANLFDVLGVEPLLGRSFQAAEGIEGAAPVLALSEETWRSHFGADPSVLGRTLDVGETAYTVVAVMGPELDALVPGARFWIPTSAFSRDPYVTVWYAVGRMPASTALTVARERLSASPVIDPTGEAYVGRIEPLRQALVGDTRPVLLTFLALVMALLLIASVNLANLLLARAWTLNGEWGLREALGASRLRLLRETLVDGIALGTAGAAGGLLLGIWLRRMVLAWAPTTVNVAGGAPMLGLREGGPGGVEAIFAGLVAVSLCAVLTVWSTRRVRAPVPAARMGGTRGSADRRLRMSQRVLTVAQIGATFVLLTGSVLLLRNALRLTAVEPGFATTTAGGIAATLPESGYPDAADQEAVIHRLVDRIESVPGVVRAAAVDRPPLRGLARTRVDVEGADTDSERWSARLNVDAGFFEAMGIELVRGRPFRSSDAVGAPEVAVVSESFVRSHLPIGDPLGRRVRIGGEEAPWRTVVGVTRDIRLRGPAHDVESVAFEPLGQTGAWSRYFTVVFRTRGPATDATGQVRAALREVEDGAALLEVDGYEQWLRRSPGYAEARFRALVAGLLGGVALALALVGVYGVAAYRVRRGTRELGIRIALGAGPRRLVSSVLLEGLFLTAAGVAIGGLVAWVMVARLQPFLLDIPARDLLTFAAVAGLLGAVSILASVRPAVAAAAVEPAEALREEL